MDNLFVWSCGLAALGFVAVGWVKSYVADEPKALAVIETLALGAVAASAAYAIGNLLEKIVTN